MLPSRNFFHADGSYQELDGFSWGQNYGTETCNGHGRYESLLIVNLQLEEHSPFVPPEISLLSSFGNSWIWR